MNVLKVARGMAFVGIVLSATAWSIAPNPTLGLRCAVTLVSHILLLLFLLEPRPNK
jgi:hypothetical protein